MIGPNDVSMTITGRRVRLGDRGLASFAAVTAAALLAFAGPGIGGGAHFALGLVFVPHPAPE